ncbi:CvpA family protein [Anaerocolumna sp. AGMB13025]|uniref:CvpA family protein n=1 Tax=Anaerocolumna sp. AGMB13025 TaxID=3039116 RepID=UPI00241C4508|nr:CvpA family protein [Anaerocolumna sp. AGMB13025]WFR57591.1 CvpA family protein [Anaerocolumna sp. AGMB13025]
MNWLVILVIIVLAGYAFNGHRRGFIRTVFTLFSTILSLILTMWVSPVISKELQKNDKIMNFVTEKVEKVITFTDEGNKITDQVNFINKLPLPKIMKHTLIENNTKDVYQAMDVNNFKDYISESVARIIINAAVFLVIVLFITIGLALLCETLDIISKLPLINGLNKTAGLLAGLLHGIIVVWIGCIFLTLLSSTEWGKTIFELINKSEFLSTLYNNNLLLKFIMNLGKILF